MAKKKSNFNAEDALASVLGFPEAPLEGQMTTDDLEAAITTAYKKSKGRPKTKGETKKKVTLTLLPSLYEKAAEKAYNEGTTMSALISELLEKYISEDKQ